MGFQKCSTFLIIFSKVIFKNNSSVRSIHTFTCYFLAPSMKDALTFTDKLKLTYVEYSLKCNNMNVLWTMLNIKKRQTIELGITE